jgi:hypothetical protein
MRCRHCRGEAEGVCAFCGRGCCSTCWQEMPNLLTVYLGAGDVPKAIVVADALWCGTCRPQPEPIPMPEIY